MGLAEYKHGDCSHWADFLDLIKISINVSGPSNVKYAFLICVTQETFESMVLVYNLTDPII